MKKSKKYYLTGIIMIILSCALFLFPPLNLTFLLIGMVFFFMSVISASIESMDGMKGKKREGDC